MHACTTCQEAKKSSEFYPRRDGRPGRSTECKACHGQRSARNHGKRNPSAQAQACHDGSCHRDGRHQTCGFSAETRLLEATDFFAAF